MGSISKLPEIERENYIKFHEKLWKEDLEVAKKLGKENNRWAIIAGYYAMHNLTKLFLAKKFGVKITGKFVHAATLECFKERLKELNTNSKEKEELINLLSYAKKKRSEVQYYVGREERINVEFFINEIVLKFINKLVKLL